MKESDYPWTGQMGTSCNYEKDKVAVTMTKLYYVEQNSVSALKAAIA